MLEKLSLYLLEYVFPHLSPRDYAELCLTSRFLYLSISDYLHHFILTSDKEERIDQFFAINKHLLLPNERVLYEAFLTLISKNPDVVYQRLPLYREILASIETSEDITRVSIIKSHVFGYLGDRDHVFIQHSELLKRDVVHLREISWLYFSTNLPKFRSKSYPASYRIRLHFQIRTNVIWKGDKPMVVRLENCGTAEVMRHYFLHPSVWKNVVQGEEFDLSYNIYNDANLKIVPSSSPSWYFIVIDNVLVEEGDELCFTIDDRQNVFWKSGKSWDFLEVLKID